MDKNHEHLLILLEVALIAALAMALEYIPHKTGISSVEMSYGVIPISVLALRRGLWPAMGAGLTWGLLDLVIMGLPEGSVLNVTQGFIEYPVAFAVAGLGGLMFHPFQKALQAGRRGETLTFAALAVLIGTFAKYLCHFYAGWIFWGQYAPKGMSAWYYSLVINGLSAIFTGVLALLVIETLVSIAQHLFMPKNVQHLKPTATR